MQPPSEKPFRVIIVGGGVGGLTLAHSLRLAGIDYVLLDKHPIAPAWGSSISIQPLASRILHQIGCLNAVEKLCTPMEQFYNRTPDGRNFLSAAFFTAITQRNGYLTYTLERRAYLQALYDQLPDKSQIHEDARVSNVIEENSSVRVLLDDGTEHEGDLVVGADGVHSAVRELMWRKAHQLQPGLITAAEKQSISTTYNCLIGCSSLQPGLGDRDMTNVCNNKFSLLFLCQPDYIFFICNSKLPNDQKIVYPNHVRYTEADVEAKAAELAHLPVSETLVFGDVWKSRVRAHLVTLEEGVLKHWFFGRSVLCGDSAHKVTPNAAFGGSLAMESAVVLANEINRAVKKHPNKKPSNVEMQIALQRYQDLRIPRVKKIFNVSWMLTRLQAWDGWFFYVMQRWIMPLIGLDFIAANIAEACSEAPKLDYVDIEEKTGTLPWKPHKTPEDLKLARRQAEKSGEAAFHDKVVPVVLSTLLVFASALYLSVGAVLRVPIEAGSGLTSAIS